MFVVVFAAGEARAWDYYETESGERIAWEDPVLSYVIDQTGVDGLELKDTIAAIDRSFATWSAVNCSSVDFSSDGVSDDLYDEVFDARYDSNSVLFVKSRWPDSATAVALTLMTYNLRTGEMRDADIMLNEDHMSFGVQPAAGAGMHDIQNTVTHEIGHVLGMAHSAVNAATMAVSAPVGETSKRDLHEDDIEGLCAAYPAGSGPDPGADVEGDAVAVLADESDAQEGEDGGGCSTGGGEPSGTALLLLALLALVVELKSGDRCERRICCPTAAVEMRKPSANRAEARVSRRFPDFRSAGGRKSARAGGTNPASCCAVDPSI